VSVTAEHLDGRLTALFASDPAAMADPHSIYRDVRQAARAYTYGPMVLVTGYDDVKAVLRDEVHFSNQAAHAGSRAEAVRAGLGEADREAFDEVAATEALFLGRTDGEQHARLRRITLRAFTPARIAQLESAIQLYLDELLAPLAAGGTVDLGSLAFGLPLRAICDMLAIPAADRDRIRGWAAAIERNKGEAQPEPLRDALRAHRQFRAYIDGVVADHRRSPGSGGELVAALLDASEGDRMTEDEVAATYEVLLAAGHETVTNLLGIGLYELLRRPAEWQALVADPALIPNAVEELLRFVTPTQWLPRFAIADVEIGGVTVASGTTVVPLVGAANRDPEVFADPDRLDVRRPEADRHLALGFGFHYCLGASLARLEARTALRALAERFPALELAEDRPEWTGNAMLRRLTRVPVTTLAPEER
jgi:cytochrome P450